MRRTGRFLLLSAIAFMISLFLSGTAALAYDLSMDVINVGQGLALLFESGGSYMLYDGGDRDYSSKVVSYLKKKNVKQLDYIIASHYDADHLNGVVGALNVFDVQTVIAPDYTTDTKVYESFTEILQEKGLTITYPQAGQQFEFGNSEITVLAPGKKEYSDVNDYSVAVRVTCNQNSILVTGDATALSESEMIESGQNLNSDVLVVGHHGSAGSTSPEFLQSVLPGAAIISCEFNNQYRHPSQEVMERLLDGNIPVYRTDKQGDLSVFSDGSELTYSVEACEDYSYAAETAAEPQQTDACYVLNNNTMKFHYPSCRSVEKIKQSNYGRSNESRDTLISWGYSPCGNCKP